MDWLGKFSVKKIFRFTKCKVLNNIKNNKKKMNKTLKGDILKFSELDRLLDDLEALQYLVIFPNEEGDYIEVPLYRRSSKYHSTDR